MMGSSKHWWVGCLTDVYREVWKNDQGQWVIVLHFTVEDKEFQTASEAVRVALEPYADGDKCLLLRSPLGNTKPYTADHRFIEQIEQLNEGCFKIWLRG
jgi:hypothetical protein